MTIIVQKYGGTSVATVERIRTIAKKIIKEYKKKSKIVVVVSAMAGETTRLLNLAHSINTTNTSPELDIIAATGEQVSVALLCLALKNEDIPTKSYLGWQIPIITNTNFTQARIKTIQTENILQNLAQNKVIVVAGFQGVSEANEITTLGRGGSDTSAVALAVALNATECQIYTDVNGVYNADPNLIVTAKRIAVIDGKCMLENASLGAKVLHVRSCELGFRYKTNIRVLSSFAPQDQGSLIMNDHELENYPVISINLQENQTLFKVILNDKSNLNTLLIDLYVICALDMLQIHDSYIIFVIENNYKNSMLSIFSKYPTINVSSTQNLTKISMVGSGFRSNNILNQQIWQLLDNIEIFATSHNEISMSILVHKLDALDVRNKLTTLLN